MNKIYFKLQKKNVIIFYQILLYCFKNILIVNYILLFYLYKDTI